ncbi:MAG: glycosyltransferase, partial [Gammaproteobacteria bacterium]
DVEYTLRRLPKPDVIWVPCFRQRDVAAAARYAHRNGVPLVFDPLISAWDKQVNERGKFSANSMRAQRLLAWERRIFAQADVVIADTAGHADFFHEMLGVARDRLVVVPVGAEEELFRHAPWVPRPDGEPLEGVFFGTFIGLQGVDHLVEAIGLYAANPANPPVRFRLLGDGPLRPACEARAAELRRQYPALDVAFEDWRPLAELPARLAQADFFFGIFGTSDKAQRVIPNKVYQSLPTGRPVITAATPAFAAGLRADEEQGLFWCRAGDAESLAVAMARLVAQGGRLSSLAASARHTYETHYSMLQVRSAVQQALSVATPATGSAGGGR